MLTWCGKYQQRRHTSQRNKFSRGLGGEALEVRSLLTSLVWSASPQLPEPRTDAVAIVASNDDVYLFGGDAARPVAASRLGADSDGWVPGQDIDTRRNDLGAVRRGNAIYLFGGTGNTEGSDETLAYDDLFGDSQDGAKMNAIRYDFGYAADGDGRVYAIGGIGVYDDGEVWAQAERYDPTRDVWSQIASLPQALHGMSAIGDGQGHIFVFGGSTTLDDSGIQGTTYRYDTASGTWSTVAPMPNATRDSAAVMDDSGEIYVLGGMSSSGATDAVQVYDSATNSWAQQTPLSEPVYSHAAAYDSLGRILVAGGFDSTGVPTARVYHTQRLNSPETAPMITTSPVTSGSLDEFYTYDADAYGNPEPTYSLVSAPAGMTIDSATGLISWQPIAGQLGIHSVTARASNRVGENEQTFDIEVLGDTIAPTTPANLTVDSVGETSATLRWAASTDAVGVDHYELNSVVHRRQRWRRWNVYTQVATVASDVNTVTLNDLTPLSSTNYVVRAFDAAGNASGYSAEAVAVTLSAPDLTFHVGTQTTGTIQHSAKSLLEIQLASRANPTATFSLLSGPVGMQVDAISGLVQWIPTVDDIGLNMVTFRGTNSVGAADLTVSIDIIPDAPLLSVQYNPTTGGQRHALAGDLFTAQISDASNSPSTFALVSAPVGMIINSSTGQISWTPAGEQGGAQTVTVRGTNAGGATDLTFDVQTLFTGAVTNPVATGTTLLNPTASWNAPTGEGANLVASYQVDGIATWGVGRTKTTDRVSYRVPVSETSVLMTGLVTGKAYTLTITPVDAADNLGLSNTGTVFVSVPALPQLRWSVNGFSGGSSVPGSTIAGQPSQIVLTDQAAAPSTITLVSGPAGMTFDPVNNTADWTPGAADVTTGYATTHVTFRATNRVGTVDIVVPVRVFFSGAVRNASTTRYGNNATASWVAPTDRATPLAGYSITRSWTWSGRPRSVTWTVGNVTSISFALIPTGAVVHKGISITPIDANGNLGVSSGLIRYGERVNNLAPVAVHDSYGATEEVALTVNVTEGVRANDIDTDNTPLMNPLTVRVVSGPANGTLALATAGSFTYTPNANFSGVDQYTYVANDGKFNSNVATVTINVASSNDVPSALDDHYSVDQDTPLNVDVGNGVLANDTDADGDAMTVTVVANPTNGSLLLKTDGSFVYTPDAGFSGRDSFTYVTNDALIDSRTATVAIAVNAAVPPTPPVTPAEPGTKFYVVDIETAGTFAYDAGGNLRENYDLHGDNSKPHGATSSKDGTIVWTLDKNGKVFVYDGDGQLQGAWVPNGPSKFDGIATDETDIWIVDRGTDTVYRYAGGASLRSGAAGADSSFPLNAGNGNATGITTDGLHIWVVDDGDTDTVFKYAADGTSIGSWTLDAANTSPTGITVDPNDVNHIWVVDNGSQQVYQYDAATSRNTGRQAADSSFRLSGGNSDPQGIADPAPSEARAATVDAAIEQDAMGNFAGLLG